MTDHSQQRRHPPSQQSLQQDRSSDDEQDGDALIEDEYWPPRTHTSAIRYQNTDHGVPTGTALVRTTGGGGRVGGVPARRSALLPQRAGGRHAWPPPVPLEREPSLPPPHQREGGLRLPWPLWVGLGMLIMILGWIALTTLGVWWQTTQDDWHYGRPRTFQADAVVGHNHDSPAHPSHFLALNLNRHILVIELPAGDPSKARIYSGPVLLGQGQELTPVTPSFQDVNSDGETDLLVWVAGTHIVFLNDGGGFRPARPGEVAQVSS
jgi:hypothetical protein